MIDVYKRASQRIAKETKMYKPQKQYEEFSTKDDAGLFSSYYYDEHTLYIENNGKKDEEVIALVDKIIKNHPAFPVRYPPGKEYSWRQEYFYISLHQEKTVKTPKRDCMYIFIYDERLYR
jgi:hypothetical protein